MATSDFGTNHPLAVKLWSKKLFREALAETYASKFMGTSKDSLCVVQDDLNKSPGDRIRVGLRMQLASNGIIGDATLEGNEEALVTYSDDFLVEQHRHAVRSGGEMSEQRIPFSVREEAKDGLRDWWADRIDSAFFFHLAGVPSATASLKAGGNTPTEPTSAAGNVRIFYGSGGDGTEASLTFTSSAEAVSNGRAFTLAMLDLAVNQAKIASPLIRPLKVDGQDKYVAFLHPNQVRQLRSNNTANTVTWYDIMRARVQGGERSGNPIFNGATIH